MNLKVDLRFPVAADGYCGLAVAKEGEESDRIEGFCFTFSINVLCRLINIFAWEAVITMKPSSGGFPFSTIRTENRPDSASFEYFRNGFEIHFGSEARCFTSIFPVDSRISGP